MSAITEQTFADLASFAQVQVDEILVVRPIVEEVLDDLVACCPVVRGH